MLLLAFTFDALPGPFELVELVLDEAQLVLLPPVDECAFFAGRLPLRACSDEDREDVVAGGSAESLVVAAVAVEAAILRTLTHSRVCGLF